MSSQTNILNRSSAETALARYKSAQNADRPLKVLFVCTGNICRSPLAHAVFAHQVRERGLDACFETESAGTEGYHVGENADHRARKTAASHGVRLDHPARKLERYDIHRYDIIFAMDAGHFRHLKRLEAEVGGDTPKAAIFMYRDFEPAKDPAGTGRQSGEAPDVPDPYYDGLDAFESVYRITERCTKTLLSIFEPAG